MQAGGIKDHAAGLGGRQLIAAYPANEIVRQIAGKKINRQEFAPVIIGRQERHLRANQHLVGMQSDGAAVKPGQGTADQGALIYQRTTLQVYGAGIASPQDTPEGKLIAAGDIHRCPLFDYQFAAASDGINLVQNEDLAAINHGRLQLVGAPHPGQPVVHPFARDVDTAGGS